MIILERDSDYKDGNMDCVYTVKSGDLTTQVLRIGYKTTFDDCKLYENITEEDIKDLYIYICWNEDDNNTFIFISIREDWDLIYVGKKTGNYVGNADVIMSSINAWVHNN